MSHFRLTSNWPNEYAGGVSEGLIRRETLTWAGPPSRGEGIDPGTLPGCRGLSHAQDFSLRTSCIGLR